MTPVGIRQAHPLHRSLSCKLYIAWGGQGLARVEERGHLVTPGAAVHRHILDRMNAINDSLKR